MADNLDRLIRDYFNGVLDTKIRSYNSLINMTHDEQNIAKRDALIRYDKVIAESVALIPDDRAKMLSDIFTKRISWLDVRAKYNRSTTTVKEHRDKLKLDVAKKLFEY